MKQIGSNAAATMTSREIADLVESRHDSVKLCIERLVARAVISHPPMVDGEKSANGVVEQQYLVCKRDSYIIVAQLSPEFTARLVDRWQELEAIALPAARPRAVRAPSVHRAALSMVKPALAAAKAFGLTGNQMALSADKFITGATGISPLALMGQTHLIADQRGQTLTPTALGKERGISGLAMNRLLAECCAQEAKNGNWAPTDLGAPHCEWLDTGKKHSGGTPIKQLKWFASVCDLLPK